jgi:TetR/AcrR family transcriptional repressor of nem operon
MEQMIETQHQSKTRLLDAALTVIRAKGYTATRIEDVCEAAGLTKGSFFHHFKGKEDLALAAAAHWGAVTGAVFAAAPYHRPADSLDRLLAYIDFRKDLLRGELPEFTCLAGTMVQEIYDTNPAIRDACAATISEHAATLETDIETAIAQYGIAGDWSARSLALYTLAKAKDSPEVVAQCLDHLRRYVELLFRQPRAMEGPS